MEYEKDEQDALEWLEDVRHGDKIPPDIHWKILMVLRWLVRTGANMNSEDYQFILEHQVLEQRVKDLEAIIQCLTYQTENGVFIEGANLLDLVPNPELLKEVTKCSSRSEDVV